MKKIAVSMESNATSKEYKPTTKELNEITGIWRQYMDSPSKGTGKPEQLKHKLTISWCRRLTQTDRLIYKFDDT